MRFEPNQSVTTETPEVVVDAGLAPGRYRFQLRVINGNGAVSRAAQHIVVIRPRVEPQPTPVPTPIPTPVPVPIPIPVPGPAGPG